jgi:hypothetical protein
LGLANDGLQCASLDLVVIWNWNGDRRSFDLFLHDDVTAALVDVREAMFLENIAYLLTR